MKELAVAERLAEIRAAHNLTQEELAAALGVSNKTISKWETGLSEPGLSMLVKLSAYYHVTIDTLLGINVKEPVTFREKIKKEFQGLDREQAVQKLFDIDAWAPLFPFSDENISICAVPQVPEGMESGRSVISTSEFYSFFVCSDEVNLSVKLFRNQADFAWLSEEKKRKKIEKLFSFLSDEDALKLCRYMHDVACPMTVTGDFAAKQLEIDEKKASSLLETACGLGLCDKFEARLKNGNTILYKMNGSGNILALITLAYEHMCGKNYNDSYYHDGEKMIGRREEK